MNHKLKKNEQGFTLVELMTVIAIIAILATAVIMSLSSHKKRAEGSKALTELSAVMQNIYLCIADEGVITPPSGNGGVAICTGPANPGAYGVWPDLASGALVNFSFASHGDFATASWGYSALSTDGTLICCNSTSGRCENLELANRPCSATKILK